jgi:hypothetical protein
LVHAAEQTMEMKEYGKVESHHTASAVREIFRSNGKYQS